MTQRRHQDWSKACEDYKAWSKQSLLHCQKHNGNSLLSITFKSTDIFFPSPEKIRVGNEGDERKADDSEHLTYSKHSLRKLTKTSPILNLHCVGGLPISTFTDYDSYVLDTNVSLYFFLCGSSSKPWCLAGSLQSLVMPIVNCHRKGSSTQRHCNKPQLIVEILCINYF